MANTPESLKQRGQDTINTDMKNAQLDPVAAFDHTSWHLLTQKVEPASVRKTLG